MNVIFILDIRKRKKKIPEWELGDGSRDIFTT